MTLSFRFLCTLVGLLPGAACGAVLYRWGGAPAPPAAVVAGRHDYVRAPWTAIGGGSLFQLDADDGAIRPLHLDPRANIAPTAARQGGALPGELFDAAFDGDLATSWLTQAYQCAERARVYRCDDIYGIPGAVQIDLMGLYAIDHVTVVSGQRESARVARDFRVHVAPEVPHLSGRPAPFRPVAAEVRDNLQVTRVVPVAALGRTRFLQVAFGEHDAPWEVDEIQVYATGYVDRARYTSPIVDFGRPMIWGALRWSGRKGPESAIHIQTRSGADADPVLYWRYTGRALDRERVTRSEYDALAVGERAGTSYDRDGWSFWSAPYAFGDSLVARAVSPGPRRYFQVQVEFLPQLDDGGQLRLLELWASEPLATDLVAEVTPRSALAGEATRFTYALRPTIAAADAGFDRLELRTAARIDSVLAVRVGDAVVAHAVERLAPGRVVLALPRLEARDSGALVEVDLAARVLRYGTTFDGFVWDSRQPDEVAQSVRAGDATRQFEGDGVWVATAVRGRFLRAAVSPSVLTPNGDGINDAALLSYEILEVTASAEVRVEVRDLAGRRVRRLHGGQEGVGDYEAQWDGRDDTGRPVPPGLYLVAVLVDTRDGPARQVLPICVVY